MRRAAVLAAVVAALGAPAAAHAQILSPGDAEELAQTLAEATEVQGVCYGWRLGLDNEGLPMQDIGSNAGPRVAIGDGGPCERFVELEASVTYTSETSEFEDRASWEIDSNLAKPPTVGELSDLGFKADDLLGEQDDVTLANAVGALPALVADHGEAKPVPFEAGSSLPPEQQGEPTGDTGSDFLRENGSLLALSLLLLLGGLVWLAYTFRPRPKES